MTEPEPTHCTCPPLGDLLAAYADGDELPCVIHRPTRRPPVPALALNNSPGLVARIRNALRADERLRGDPDTAPPAA
ncbi:MAG: hypothetical protein M3Q22_03835 [Actinomycetota bacterium]|nr:hypothetical protein [Actinomycetota bacterium]